MHLRYFFSFHRFLFVCYFILLSSACASGSEAPLAVTFFAVGKADSILIRQGGSTMLIDTATSQDAPYIMSRLRQEGVYSIDVLQITHMDMDHVGGTAQIIRNFPVTRVCQPKHRKGSIYYKDYAAAMREKSIEPIVLTEDLSFPFASCDVTIHAPGAVRGMVPNDYSLMTSLFYGSCSILFTGDATPLRIDKFLENTVGHYDVLKVPHHGMIRTSKSNFSALLRRTTPQYAVITDSVRDNLRAKVSLFIELLGTKNIFMTDKGDVELLSDGSNITIKSLGNIR